MVSIASAFMVIVGGITLNDIQNLVTYARTWQTGRTEATSVGYVTDMIVSIPLQEYYTDHVQQFLAESVLNNVPVSVQHDG